MRGKLHVFFYHSETLTNIKLQNELVLGVANSAQMDEKLGEKLLVQKMLLRNEFMVV